MDKLNQSDYFRFLQKSRRHLSNKKATSFEVAFLFRIYDSGFKISIYDLGFKM